MCLNVDAFCHDGPQQWNRVVARGDHERGKRRQGATLTEGNHAAM